MSQKRVLIAVGLNKNSFCLHVQLPPLGAKTNLRENRFFAAGGRLVDRNGSFCVKFLAKSLTKAFVPPTRLWATSPKSTYAYNRQCERLQGILPTVNGDSIIEMQK